MARFLIDAQLPPGIVALLRAAGYDADHVAKIGMGSASDRDVWKHACRIGVVLVTKDADFLRIAETSSTRVPIVWVRIGNTTNAALSGMFTQTLPSIVAALESGESVIELR